MLIAIRGVKLYAQCYTWSEAISPLLYIELSFMLIAINEMKRYAHCYTWINGLCSMLYKE